MSKETAEEVVPTISTQPDELTLLKNRAKLMGITHHPSIGLVKLKAKVNARLEGDNLAEAMEEKQEELTTIQKTEELLQEASILMLPAIFHSMLYSTSTLPDIPYLPDIHT